jgi:HK97 family phage prohead protease
MANDTLHLSEEGGQVRFDAELVETSYATDLLALIRRRDTTGVSPGFRPIGAPTIERHEDGRPLRVFPGIQMIEVSLTSYPANRGVSVEARTELAVPSLPDLAALAQIATILEAN